MWVEPLLQQPAGETLPKVATENELRLEIKVQVFGQAGQMAYSDVKVFFKLNMTFFQP